LRGDQFNQIVEESIAAGRRKGIILGIFGQPPDHPSPLAMPELRYLKFNLVQLD
jgi:23S rRNA G2069 N7-methylase RlmK/C1962 C5-methylase RlmI